MLNWIHILKDPEFRVSLVQKKNLITFQKVGETRQLFYIQKQGNIGQFFYNLYQNLTIMLFFKNVFFFRVFTTYCNFWMISISTGKGAASITKKNLNVRSYPLCPILPLSMVEPTSRFGIKSCLFIFSKTICGSDTTINEDQDMKFFYF